MGVHSPPEFFPEIKRCFPRSRPDLALIFPPAAHPTSPPLGPACLKGFLEDRAVCESITLFDLNLAYYEQALRWLEDGRLKVTLRHPDQAATAHSVMDAYQFFRGRHGMDTFLDLSSYHRHASFYLDFGATTNGLFEYFARRFVAGLRVPHLAEQYFHELLEPVKKANPRVVGFSLLFSRQFYFTLALAKCLKEEGISVVLGGATLSVMPQPENLLADSLPTMIDNTVHRLDVSRLVDFLIVGEGEEGLAELMRRLDGDLSQVPGLVYAEDGRVKINSPGRSIDLNCLPLPDFTDLPVSRYHSPLPVLPYLSSRGCFWQRCAFCTHRKTYLAYREEDVERTADRLSMLKTQYGVSHFNLVDEMIHPHRFGRLSRALLQRGVNLKYSAYAKPTESFTRPFLEKLHRSGLRVLMWGVESGSQRVLDLMKKGTRVEDMDNALRQAHEAGIRNMIFLLFGFPSETEVEWEDTLKFVERHRVHIEALSKSHFLLLKGSDVFNHPDRYHIARILDRPARDPVSVAYDYEVTQGLSQAEVQELYRDRLPVLDRYGRSPYFGIFRDHLLIHASENAP